MTGNEIDKEQKMEEVQLIKVESEVTKELFEVYDGLNKILEVTFKELEDGWQPGKDLPVILASSLQALLGAIEGIHMLGPEHKEQLAKAVKTHFVGAGKLSATIIDHVKK